MKIKKMFAFVLTGIISLFYSTFAFASEPVVIELPDGAVYYFAPGTYEGLSEEQLNRIFGIEEEVVYSMEPKLTLDDEERPVLELNGEKYIFIADEFKNMAQDELVNIVNTPKLKAAANLQNRSLANNVSGSWGPWSANVLSNFIYSPRVSAAARLEVVLSSPQNSHKPINTTMTVDSNTHLVGTGNAGTYTLTVRNWSAGTVTVGGTFEIRAR